MIEGWAILKTNGKLWTMSPSAPFAIYDTLVKAHEIRSSFKGWRGLRGAKIVRVKIKLYN